MRFYRPPWLARLLCKDAVWNLSREKEEIFLTFDDGPSEHTPAILDILKGSGAKATFFCTGKQVEQHPDYFKRIIEEGHTVGNHSYSHLNGRKTGTKSYLEDLDKAETLIPSSLFRPPYGKITWRQYAALKKKYRIVFWDLMCYDFNTRLSAEDCYSIIRKYIRNGSVIVLHDSSMAFPRNIECLKRILKAYSSMSFSILSID